MRWLCLAAAVGLSCAPAWAAQTPAPARVGAAQLMADVRTLAADDMEGRATAAPGGLKARAYVARRFSEAGLRRFGRSYIHPFKRLSERPPKSIVEGANVVGWIKGTGRSKRVIVVSAHYDHLGVREGEIYNGADDNASGVAALLALAAHFKAHPPRHSLVFVAFDGEELDLLGALAFVKAPPVARGRIALNVNLDMVGRSEKGELYAVGALATPALRPVLEEVAARAPVKLRLGHEGPGPPEGQDWTGQSDQYAFVRAGIPFVYFGVEDHSDYHRPTDDADRIEPVFFTGAVETILSTVEALDGRLEGLDGGQAPQPLD